MHLNFASAFPWSRTSGATMFNNCEGQNHTLLELPRDVRYNIVFEKLAWRKEPHFLAIIYQSKRRNHTVLCVASTTKCYA